MALKKDDCLAGLREMGSKRAADLVQQKLSAPLTPLGIHWVPQKQRVDSKPLAVYWVQ